MFDKGISLEGELIDLSQKYNITRKSGAFYTFKDLKLGQGRENAKDFLLKNKKVAKEIEKEIRHEYKKMLAIVDDVVAVQSTNTETGEISGQ